MNYTSQLDYMKVLCFESTVGPVYFDRIFNPVPKVTCPQVNKMYFPFDAVIRNYKYFYANFTSKSNIYVNNFHYYNAHLW